MAYTLGPWSLQELPHVHAFRQSVNYAVRDARNCCLAQVGHVDAIHDGAETEANARLIAAAPELLAALEMAHETLSGHKGYAQGTTATAIRAAIRAAKGG